MTAENEKKIIEMIEQAEVVADPLENLVERVKANPGAAFEPDVLTCLADLEKQNSAQFHQLRSELKKVGVPVAKLDKAIAELNGHVRRRGSNQAETLVQFAADAELFHTPDRTAYADIYVDGHRETWEISSQGFSDWLDHRYFQEMDGVPSPEVRKSAIRHLEGRARFKAPEREVHLRVAAHDGLMYVDLADPAWRAIEMGPSRWKVVENPPVRFRRPSGMLALPEPEPGAGIEELLPFLNVSRSDAVLVAHWLINSLLPCRSYPILVLQGESGTAKTGTSCLLRALLDPNVVPLRGLPRNEHELLISAANGHVLAFDNISNLPDWMSDPLCRVATGGGSAVRRLYSDRDEELFKAVRPMILNGIENPVTHPDLAERCILITLKHIPDERRVPQEDVWATFEQRRPRILGALLDAVGEGLRNPSEVQPKRLPRMADFARMAMACETALWPRGTFEKAYSDNREESVDAGIDADPVAAAVRALVARLRTVRTVRTTNSQHPIGTVWAGTATDLLRELETVKDEIGHRGAGWPKVPAALSNRLTRAEPFLRKRGIEIVGRREGHERTRIIYITDEEREEGREEDVREEEINQSTELVEEDEVWASEYSSAPLD